MILTKKSCGAHFVIVCCCSWGVKIQNKTKADTRLSRLRDRSNRYQEKNENFKIWHSKVKGDVVKFNFDGVSQEIYFIKQNGSQIFITTKWGRRWTTKWSYTRYVLQRFLWRKKNTYRISAETIPFWIWPYVLWPLITVHTGAETIQGRKLFAEIRYFFLVHLFAW